MLKAFGVLARLRGLRGGPLDIFGRTEERREERALIDEYERTIGDLLPRLTNDNLPIAVRIASVPEEIRGYGHVKSRHLAAARQSREELLQTFDAVKALHEAA